LNGQDDDMPTATINHIAIADGLRQRSVDLPSFGCPFNARDAL
jgi:hypothetical protein